MTGTRGVGRECGLGWGRKQCSEGIQPDELKITDRRRLRHGDKQKNILGK